MIVELWYDGKSLDLYEETDINHTLQINDIAEVKDRQASYTNTFKVPKTPNNIRILSGLGLPSSNSMAPYIKPNALLKIEGFDFLTQAWIQVRSTSEDYDIAIFSGIIEFFKKFENKTIGDELANELSEIDHSKNLTTVVNTQNDDTLKYTYLFADFNGRTHRKNDSNIVNIDFVVPSVLVSYLFDKIHAKAEYTYEGSFKDLDTYKNWYISYPKAPEDSNETEYYNNSSTVPYDQINYTGSFGFSFQNEGNEGIKILEKGVYNFQISTGASLNFPIPSGIGQLDWTIYYKLNGNVVQIPNQTNFYLLLDENDIIEFFYIVSTDWSGSITMNLKIVSLEDVLFTEEFKDLKITEFLKDVYGFFGLTPVINNDTKHINYKTNKERFKDAEAEDWSEYLDSIEKESYSLGSSYAKNNLFKYKYNDNEETHSDGAIVINNKHLADEKTIFTSFTYSVEKELVSNFYINQNLTDKVSFYKLYEKEPQDGSTELKYKPLSKRYFYLRMRKINTTVEFGSDIQDFNITNNIIKVGDFTNLNMSNVIGQNYLEFQNVINNVKVWNAELKMPYVKLLNIDLMKVYYFKQLQAYCFINKMSFDNNKSTAELIKIENFV